MMVTGAWQEKAVREICAFLQQNEDITALCVFGSMNDGAEDVWSDVDFLVVTTDQALADYHPNLEWLKPVGEIYTFEQHADEYTRVSRVCFTDFRRMDFVLTTASALRRIDEWPSVGFWKGAEVLFSRSAEISEILRRTFAGPKPGSMSLNELNDWATGFRFKAVMALQKVVRNDLLIALHLSLELVQECSVLAMVLRDRTEGTTIHKTGGIGNQAVAQLNDRRYPYTAQGILESIEQSTILFEQLAKEWSDAYQEQRFPLLEWTALARRSIHPD